MIYIRRGVGRVDRSVAKPSAGGNRTHDHSFTNVTICSITKLPFHSGGQVDLVATWLLLCI